MFSDASTLFVCAVADESSRMAVAMAAVAEVCAATEVWSLICAARAAPEMTVCAATRALSRIAVLILALATACDCACDANLTSVLKSELLDVAATAAPEKLICVRRTAETEVDATAAAVNA